MSASPCSIASAASETAVCAVAHPLKTPKTGIPVSPIFPTTASGFDTSRLPAYAR